MRTGKDKHPHGWGHRNQLSTICYRRKRSELLRDLGPAWPLPRCWLSLFLAQVAGQRGRCCERDELERTETAWMDQRWTSGERVVDRVGCVVGQQLGQLVAVLRSALHMAHC